MPLVTPCFIAVLPIYMIPPLSRRYLRASRLRDSLYAVGVTLRIEAKAAERLFTRKEVNVVAEKHAVPATAAYRLALLQRQHWIVARENRAVDIWIGKKLPLLVCSDEQVRASTVDGAPSGVACRPDLARFQRHRTVSIQAQRRIAGR